MGPDGELGWPIGLLGLMVLAIVGVIIYLPHHRKHLTSHTISLSVSLMWPPENGRVGGSEEEFREKVQRC